MSWKAGFSLASDKADGEVRVVGFHQKRQTSPSELHLFALSLPFSTVAGRGFADKAQDRGWAPEVDRNGETGRRHRQDPVLRAAQDVDLTGSV